MRGFVVLGNFRFVLWRFRVLVYKTLNPKPETLNLQGYRVCGYGFVGLRISKGSRVQGS